MHSSERCSSREFPDLMVACRGRVPALEADRVAGAIGRLLQRHGVSGGARVRLSGANCDGGPMLVQVNLHVGDTPARVQRVTARGDVWPAMVRLERQIRRLSAPWHPRPWPDRTRRVLGAPGDAVITRRKACVLLCGTPMQAVAVMDAMDYDVHLFTDAETGEDAVVYRAGPSGLRLARQCRRHPPEASDNGSSQPVRLTVHPHHTPILTEAAAVDRLCDYGLPFLFFTDSATGRGHLLYPRYDGSLGLISAAGDSSQDDAT